MITLRDYQQAAVDGVRAELRKGVTRVLLVAPTGAGKTVMFAYIAQQASQRKNRVVICAHRSELLDQISGALTQFGVEHNFVAAGRQQQARGLVTVASVQTLVNRLHTVKPSILVLDEAHHAVAGSWKKIINAYPQATVLGVTATPQRLDGSGLGDIFQTMVEGPQVADLQANGFLCPVKYFGPHTVDPSQIAKRGGEYTTASAAEALMPAGNIGKVTGEAITEYRKHADGLPAVVFCVNIRHAQSVAEQFCAAGYRWACLDSTISREQRNQVVTDLRSGALHGVSSCDIISEGFDLPAASVAILLRPTQSLGLYMQQVGRILRPAPNKPCAIVIDHVGNVGLVEDGAWKSKHGFIEERRFWSLDGKQKVKSSEILCKRCPDCFALVPISVRVCAECGYEFEIAEKKEDPSTGVIAEIDPASVGSDDWIKQVKFNEILRWARTEEQLRLVARVRGYKPAWVRVILEGRAKRK